MLKGGPGSGLVAGTHSAAANAHLLILAAVNLSLVEAAPLDQLRADAPSAALLTHFQVLQPSIQLAGYAFELLLS